MIFKIIILTLMIIIAIIQLTIIFYLIMQPIENEEINTKKSIKKKTEKNNYLQLENMTTQEILTFKDKKDFINTIKQYDSIKYFLKGTEEENTDQLIKWYYPGYKKL